MNTSFVIRGVIPPLVTPLTDGGKDIDEDALQAHVTWLIEKGVRGVMPCGTTGEGPLLATSERKRVLEVVSEAAAHRVPVIAHVGAVTTYETVELACHAQALGVEVVSVVTPYYFHLSGEALTEHFCRIADAVASTPVFLYNIPQNTGNAISPLIVESIITRCPNVIGIKDSGGDLRTLQGFTSLDGGRFQVVCGNDQLLLRALQAGACASISGNANVFPEVVVELFNCFWHGDSVGALRQQEQLDQVRELLQNGQSLSLLKRALGFRGLRGGSVRPPLLEVAPEIVASAEKGLRSLQLL